MSKVVVGGTFNVFHKGHARLLNSAIAIAAFKEAALMVGVTADNLAKRSRTVPVRPYKERLNDVMKYIEDDDLRPYFGPVVYEILWETDDMPEMSEKDVLVVSEETAMHAFEILAKKGYDCEVHVVEMLTDKDGNEIHSTKILEERK